MTLTDAVLIALTLVWCIAIAWIYFRSPPPKVFIDYQRRRNEIHAKAIAIRFLASNITVSDRHAARKYDDMMYEAECVQPYDAWAADLETVMVWHPFRGLSVAAYTEIVESLKDEILNALNKDPPWT